MITISPCFLALPPAFTQTLHLYMLSAEEQA